MKIAMGEHWETESTAMDFVCNNFLETSNMHWNIIFLSSPPDCGSWRKISEPSRNKSYINEMTLCALFYHLKYLHRSNHCNFWEQN